MESYAKHSLPSTLSLPTSCQCQDLTQEGEKDLLKVWIFSIYFSLSLCNFVLHLFITQLTYFLVFSHNFRIVSIFFLVWHYFSCLLKIEFLRSGWKNDMKRAVDFHNNETNILNYFQKAVMVQIKEMVTWESLTIQEMPK